MKLTRAVKLISLITLMYSAFSTYQVSAYGVFTQKGGEVHYNWGLKSPNTTVPVDNFKASFDQSRTFASGDYFIQTLADDGVKVTVDGQTKINRWSLGAGRIDRATWLGVKSGYHQVRIDYFENRYSAAVFSDIVPFNSWLAYYYPNISLSGYPIAAKVIKPTATNNLLEDNRLGSPMPGKVPSDYFSARYVTARHLPEGDYLIRGRADDGIRVYVDGKLVINRYTPSGYREDSTKIHINNRTDAEALKNPSMKDVHWIEVHYFDRRYTSKVETIIEPYRNNATSPVSQKPTSPSPSIPKNTYYQKGGEVHYNWGLKSPKSGIPADNFQAVFDQSRTLSSGDYFIQTLADDGVKVTVDEQTKINRWSNSAGKIDRAIWLGVKSGNHQIKTDYYDNRYSAAVFSDIVPFNSWLAYYYPNKALSGYPVAAKVIKPTTSNNLFEDNKQGSPVPGKVPTDGFSARYVTARHLPAGDYVIRGRADDGIRVYIDGKLVVNRWTNSGYREDATIIHINDRTDAETMKDPRLKDVHWIEVHYYDNKYGSKVETIIEPYQADASSWIGEFYPNTSLSDTPVVIGGSNSLNKISELDFKWGIGSPAYRIPSDYFSARFTKKVQIPAQEKYVLQVWADDGVRVYVDGNRVIDSWVPSSGFLRQTEVNLTEGIHEIKVEYFERTGGALLKFKLSKAQIYRIPDRPYPYNNDTYYVKNNTLYHLVPNWPGGPATINLRVNPPSFIKEGNTYVKDAADRFYQRTDEGDIYVGTYVPPFKDLDLRKPSKITATEIDKFISSMVPNSPLIGHGQDYLDAQSKFGVNAQYLVAHSLLESNWGRSDLANLKHNLFGYGAADSDPFNLAYYFPSFKDSIQYEAYIVRKNYLNTDGRYYNGSNLKGMNVRYASDLDWAEKIASIMQWMRPYNSSEYNVALLSAYPGDLPTPGRIIPTTYMQGIKGRVINSAVNFREQPSTNATVYKILPIGTSFDVLERNTYNWYKVNVDGQVGWVYGDYVQVTNLLKVVNITTSLNIRQQPTTTSTVVGNVTKGALLQGFLDAEDNLVTSIQKDGTWYQVKTGDGKIGWVFGNYIQLIIN